LILAWPHCHSFLWKNFFPSFVPCPASPYPIIFYKTQNFGQRLERVHEFTSKAHGAHALVSNLNLYYLRMNTFIDFFIARLKSSWGSWVGFKFKSLLYDNAYFLLTFLLLVPKARQAHGLVSNLNLYYMTMNTFMKFLLPMLSRVQIQNPATRLKSTQSKK
jgi:hypothetical protein